MATEDALNQVAQARRMTDELIRRIRGTDAVPSFTNSDVQNSGSLRQLEVVYTIPLTLRYLCHENIEIVWYREGVCSFIRTYQC